jgi:transposase, IS5 family
MPRTRTCVRSKARRPRVFSLHAPEVEGIGKGKAHRPYEFGVKVSLATTLRHSKGGQFIVHAKTLPGKPYDGHPLGTVIPKIEKQTGISLERVFCDAGYKGHNAPQSHRFKGADSERNRPSFRFQIARDSEMKSPTIPR